MQQNVYHLGILVIYSAYEGKFVRRRTESKCHGSSTRQAYGGLLYQLTTFTAGQCYKIPIPLENWPSFQIPLLILLQVPEENVFIYTPCTALTPQHGAASGFSGAAVATPLLLLLWRLGGTAETIFNWVSVNRGSFHFSATSNAPLGTLRDNTPCNKRAANG